MNEEKKWEYRIVRNDLGWYIRKRRETNGFMSLRFLDGHGKWILRKDFARTFYHKADAVSVLQVMKARDGNESNG